jgi:hypothetical protein
VYLLSIKEVTKLSLKDEKGAGFNFVRLYEEALKQF